MKVKSKSIPALRTSIKLLGLSVGLLCAPANASVLVVAFDFENTTAGSSTSEASAVGSGISGASFAGTSPGAQVLSFPDHVFSSSSLDPNSNGSEIAYFTFTTSTSLDLGSLTFEAGQNDNVPGEGYRDFEVRLSPVDEAAPTSKFGLATSSWSLVAPISVPFGFSETTTPNFTLDLTGTTIGPGTYHIAFGTQAGIIGSGTTQLFLNSVSLTAIPEPTSLSLIGLGIAGALTNRRRRSA